MSTFMADIKKKIIFWGWRVGTTLISDYMYQAYESQHRVVVVYGLVHRL